MPALSTRSQTLVGLEADLLADDGRLAAAAERQHLDPGLDTFDMERDSA